MTNATRGAWSDPLKQVCLDVHSRIRACSRQHSEYIHMYCSTFVSMYLVDQDTYYYIHANVPSGPSSGQATWHAHRSQLQEKTCCHGPWPCELQVFALEFN